MANLSLSCLGPFQVTPDGQLVTSFKSNKVRALLTYPDVEANRPHRREVLAGLLWLKWPDQDALSNLRHTLSDLHRAIGDHSTHPLFLPGLRMIKVLFVVQQVQSKGDDHVSVQS